MEETFPPQKSFLSSRSYEALKFIAQIALPALGTFYFALASLWGLPKAEEVVGSIMSVDVFLGVLLGLSTKAYNASDAKYDGQIDVEVQDDDTKLFSLQLNSDPNDLEYQEQVVFKVNPNQIDDQKGV